MASYAHGENHMQYRNIIRKKPWVCNTISILIVCPAEHSNTSFKPQVLNHMQSFVWFLLQYNIKNILYYI